MKLWVTLIRNGSTESGEAGRYLGLLDEPLTEAGRQSLQNHTAAGRYPASRLVYSSGLMRCLQTAGIIYPNVPAVVVKELRAFHYGEFTGCSYHELAGDKQFAGWALADQPQACPGGEEPLGFLARCATAFRHIAGEMMDKEIDTAAIITHQAVIKGILQRFYAPRSFYRDWSLPYGGGYLVLYDTQWNSLKMIQEL